MSVKQRHSKKLNRKVWGYDAEIAGKRRRRFGFSSRSAAKTALANARVRANELRAGVISEQPAPSITVRELVERRSKQIRRKVTRFILKRWLDTLPAGLLVADLRTAHLSQYADERMRFVKPQTAFRELTDICSALNRASDLFPSLEGWRPPKRPRMRVPSGRRERVITKEEATAILAHMRRPKATDETDAWYSVRLDAADLLQIALLTAARRSEILSLRWSDVNFDWGTLRIVGTKTDRIRTIPMTPALVELLKRRKRDTGASARVFPALARASMLSNHTNIHYREASEALGIPYGRETEGGWVLHDARHTAITAMLHAGNSLESVMAISGHSARVMTMRYAHANEQTKRAAVSALDQFAA